MDFLLDTNFLIGLWRQPTSGPEARFLSAQPDASLGLPWIAKGEFLAGAAIAGHDLERVAVFLADYPVVLPDDATLIRYAEAFANLRKRKLTVGPNDLWIGAAAIQADLPLLTRNVRELARIEGLRVVDYVAT